MKVFAQSISFEDENGEKVSSLGIVSVGENGMLDARIRSGKPSTIAFYPPGDAMPVIRGDFRV